MQTNATVQTPSFVPRFVAGTILTLIAWSLEQAATPPPADLQEEYRALVGGALLTRPWSDGSGPN